MKLNDFDYELPEDLIATEPLTNRTQSRLLVVNKKLEDHQFEEITNYLNPGDLLIANNTKVIKARLFGNKISGGKVEVMFERILNNSEFIAHIRTSKTIKIGMQIILPDELSVIIIERLEGGLFKLSITRTVDFYEYLEKYGNLPLPPYMNRQAQKADETRYQTVYAAHDGSVAAPTAGLHFTLELLNKIKDNGIDIGYVTLHVGSGTFKPVSVENIAEHKMHSEIFEISQKTVDKIKKTKAKGGKIVCVGTTSLRTLETIAARGLVAQKGETDIFITPGYEFKLVDKLITNSHLPKSTLLMLVSAFSGKENIEHAYQHAIKNKYRFFSYGDAMLLMRKE